MRTLDAVNTALPYFSEQPVTNLDDRNPTVGLLVAGLQQAADDLLSEGYWFNTRSIELSPDDTRRIKAPPHILSCYAEPVYAYGAPMSCTVRGEYLWDVQRGTWDFEGAVKLRIVERLKFEDLPTYAAQCVMYRAAAQLYLTQFGNDNIYQELLRSSQWNYTQLMQEELRNRRYVMNAAVVQRWRGWLRR